MESQFLIGPEQFQGTQELVGRVLMVYELRKSFGFEMKPRLRLLSVFEQIVKARSVDTSGTIINHVRNVKRANCDIAGFDRPEDHEYLLCRVWCVLCACLQAGLDNEFARGWLPWF